MYLIERRGIMVLVNRNYELVQDQVVSCDHVPALAAIDDYNRKEQS